MEPVVDVEWLRGHRHDVVVADVRWYLDGRSGRESYLAGHLPGAVFVPMSGCLAGPASPAQGRHPLPHPVAFASCMSTLGIGDGQRVVAYDDAGGSIAARLVWMLRALGEPAALLDGGLHAWEGPLEEGPPSTPPACAKFTARPWPPDRLASIDDIASGGLVVVDARAPERYRGEVEPIDARAGHIPGAVNVPWAGNLDGATGRFLSADELRRRYEPVVGDGRDVAVHCGSGVTACHDLIAMERAGFTSARLYPGSWSHWAADPSRPIATGPEPAVS